MTRTAATSKGAKIYTGTGTVAAGTKAKTISDSHVTATSKVLVEFTADMTPAVRHWVTGKSALPIDWYNANWSYRKKITIDKDKVNATLSDFPVLVNLASDAELAASARADGYDILFTSSDGETKLKHEIELYTTGTGKLVAWVKVPSVSSSADTDIYMYYGYAASGDQSDAVNVWDSDFKMVQHMKDATTSTIEDSTSNNNDGTKVAANEPIEVSTGQMDGAQSFDYSNDKITISDAATLKPANLTVSAWFKADATGASYYPMILKSQDANSRYRYGIYINTNTIVTTLGKQAGVYSNISTAFSDTASYHHVVQTFDGTTHRLYLDGVDVNNAVWNNVFNDTNPNNLEIGFATPAGMYFDGVIDETRISSVARSADWISAEYNNQDSPGTFYTLGAEELSTATFKLNTDANVTANSTFDYAVIN